MNLYTIVADYRPSNPNKPIYYVKAKNSREAKQKFQKIITWLKIYNVIETEKTEANKILSEGKYKHIIFE